MSKPVRSAATIAAIIRSLALQGGSYSIAARLKPELVDLVAERLSHDLIGQVDEPAIIGAMGRIAAKHPQNFRTHEEVNQDLRRAWREKQFPHATHLSREAISKLAAIQKLEFVNSGVLPKNFIREETGSDD